jgi:hypothetical protein
VARRRTRAGTSRVRVHVSPDHERHRHRALTARRASGAPDTAHARRVRAFGGVCQRGYVVARRFCCFTIIATHNQASGVRYRCHCNRASADSVPIESSCPCECASHRRVAHRIR